MRVRFLCRSRFIQCTSRVTQEPSEMSFVRLCGAPGVPVSKVHPHRFGLSGINYERECKCIYIVFDYLCYSGREESDGAVEKSGSSIVPLRQ